jgi:hypothetical protein
MRYDVSFICAGLLALLIGEGVGIWTGIGQDFTFAPAHAHLNLVGWVTLCLYGLAHRAYPELAGSRLAAAQAWIAIPSAFVLPVGIAFAVTSHDVASPVLFMAVIGAFGVLIGTALFAAMFVGKERAA